MKRVKLTITDSIIPMASLIIGKFASYIFGGGFLKRFSFLRGRLFKNVNALQLTSLSSLHLFIKPYIFVGNSIVLALMTIVAPIRYESTVDGLDPFGRPDEVIYRCVVDSEQLPFVIALVAINAGCLLFAIFQAYEARNLSVEFSESTYIFQALILILLVALIGGPVILLARDDANSQTFLMCAIIFVTCCSILLLIFVPKMRFLKKQLKKEKMANTGRPSDVVRGGSSRLSAFSLTSRNGSKKGSVRISGLDLSEQNGQQGLEVYGWKTKEELLGENKQLLGENKLLRRRLERYEPQGDPSASLGSSRLDSSRS